MTCLPSFVSLIAFIGLICLLLIGLCLFSSAEGSSPKQAKANSEQNLNLNALVLNKAKDIIMSSGASIVDKSGIILMDAKVVKLWLEDVSYDLIVKSSSGKVFAVERLIALNAKHSKALASLDMKGMTFRESEQIKPSSPYADFVNRNIELYKKKVQGKRQDDAAAAIAAKTDTPAPSLPPQPQIMGNLGKDYFKDSGRHMMLSRRFADAEELYKRAFELDRKDVDVMLALGHIYASTGRLQEAEEMYKKTYSLTKSNHLLKRLGALFIIAGRYDAAIYNLQAFIRDNPLDAGARYSLALAYFMAGNKDEAYNEYIRLRRIDAPKAEDLFDLIYR